MLRMKFTSSIISFIVLFLGTVVGARTETESVIVDEVGMKTARGTMKVDIAMYTDQTWWINKNTADRVAQEIKKAVENRVKSIDFVSEENLPNWIKQNMGDGEIDIIFLFGDFPHSIYPSGNIQPDGSPAELFLEDGNMFLNTGDYIFWGGVQGRNDHGGLQNMLDSPQLFIDLINPETGWAPMSVTPLGRQYLPSLEGFQSARQFPINRMSNEWEVEASFADDGGTRADPVVVRHKENDGRVAIFYQVENDDLPRAEVISEFILNWLPTVTGAFVAVENKLANPKEQFTVNISVRGIENLHSFSFNLAFNPSTLQVVSIKEGTVLHGNETGVTSWHAPVVINEKGSVTNVQCKRIKGDGIEDAGQLAVVTFKAVKAGSSAISLQNLRLFTPNGEEISAQTRAGSVDIFPHGSISGIVRGAESKTPLSGVKIEVSKDGFSFGLFAYSDHEGKYTIDGVPVGNFDVTASSTQLPYIQTKTKAHVKQGEMTSNVDFEMKPIPRPPMAGGEESPLIGKPAPDFTLKDLNGNPVSLSDFKGKPVVLNFWATWCGPCRAEIPHMDALYKKYKEQGLVVIGVNNESDHAQVKQFAKKQISYIVLLDGRPQFQEYGVRGIPCTYYVDKAGIVRYRDVGFGSGGEREIERKIMELLQ